MERYSDAIKIFQNALNYHPDNATIHYNIGYVHLLSGNASKAYEVAERLCSLDDELSLMLFDEIDKRE